MLRSSINFRNHYFLPRPHEPHKLFELFNELLELLDEDDKLPFAIAISRFCQNSHENQKNLLKFPSLAKVCTNKVSIHDKTNYMLLTER